MDKASIRIIVQDEGAIDPSSAQGPSPSARNPNPYTPQQQPSQQSASQQPPRIGGPTPAQLPTQRFDPVAEAGKMREAEIRREMVKATYDRLYDTADKTKSALDSMLEIALKMRGTLGGAFGGLAGPVLDIYAAYKATHKTSARAEAERRLDEQPEPIEPVISRREIDDLPRMSKVDRDFWSNHLGSEGEELHRAIGGEIPPAPGVPLNADEVPVRATAGEFIVNKAAAQIPENRAVLEEINSGGEGYARGGKVERHRTFKNLPEPPDEATGKEIWDKIGKKIGSIRSELDDVPAAAIPHESMGIPRVKMPQIPPEQFNAFMERLAAKGIRSEMTTMPVGEMKPSQGEIGVEKIAKNALKSDKKLSKKTIVVSADDYIVDGHHGWAGALVGQGKNFEMNALKIQMPIRELLDEARNMPGVFYKAVGMASGGSVRHPSPRHYASGGSVATSSPPPKPTPSASSSVADALMVAAPEIGLVLKAEQLVKDAVIGGIRSGGDTLNSAISPDANAARSVEALGENISRLNPIIGEMTSAFGRLMGTIDGVATRYAEFSPEIAQAQGAAEIRQTMGDLRRGQEAGGDLARYVEMQSNVQQKFEDVKIKVLLKILPIVEVIGTILGEAVSAGSNITDAITSVAIPLNALVAVSRWIAGNQEDANRPEVTDPTNIIINLQTGAVGPGLTPPPPT